MMKIKKELRSVQGELHKGIERLGTITKFINIWLMPMLVVFLAVFVLVFKSASSRRRYK
jgi:hypothetical protein